MRHKLLVTVIACLCLLCTAWEEAAAGPVGCNMSGLVNNQANNWQIIIPGFTQYGSAVASPITGLNVTTSAGIWGQTYAANGGFPLLITMTESQTSIASSPQFVRIYNVSLGANLQGTGTVIDVKTNGTFVGAVTISAVTCVPAANLPSW